MFLQGIKEESMKAKNKLLTLLILSAGAAVTTAGINKAIQFSAVSKNLLAEPEPLCFKWRLGNVYYTKEGTGKPLLLIHDLDTCTSGYEWKQLIPFLSSKYTVYTIVQFSLIPKTLYLYNPKFQWLSLLQFLHTLLQAIDLYI